MSENNRRRGRPLGSKNKPKENVQLSDVYVRPTYFENVKPPQTSIPENPYIPSRPPQPNVISPYAPNNNVLAPNTRPDMSKVDPDTGRLPNAPSPFPSAAGAAGGVSGFDSQRIPIQMDALGNTGTQIFGGYFAEDYLHELRGRMGARKWDEIRRSEAQVSMLMNAIMNPIKAANWGVEAYDESNLDYEKHAEFVKYNLFEKIDWNTFKHEALTMLPFGFSLFEVVHDVIINHPKFGSFNGIKSLSFRSQKTIENWQLEPKTGRLYGVNQYTYSDLGGNQFLPGEFLLVFTISKEGDNYEGISVLRPILGAYKRKDLYLKLAAIGIERYAIGTPIGTIPKGKERTTEVEEFKKVLQNYTSHESSFITKPEGWTIDFQKGDFDAGKLKELLVFENTEIANALVANFLVLGMNGGGGAYALGSNLGEFFTTGIQSYADIICDSVNRCLIPQLIKLNFGEQSGYPKLKCTGISDKAGKELAETIKLLTDARAIVPDEPLKEFLRKQYKLPKPDLSTATPLPVMPAGSTSNYPTQKNPPVDPISDKILKDEFQTIKLADKAYSKKFDANKDKLKKLMQANLLDMYGKLKDVLRTKYKSLSGTDKILAAKNVTMPGVSAYKGVLREALADYANESIANARKLVPAKKNVKLSGFDALPPGVRKLIETQASLVAETQAADIEKMTFFQFTSSATSSDDVEAILYDVDGKVLSTIDGSTKQGMSVDVAASDALAHVVQQSAFSFFFDPDVLDGIESFTFTNEDPVSECCQELAGTTFAVNDPDLDRYAPPLHHNCKSRLVPNLVGDDSNPDIDRGGVSLSKSALSAITLAEVKHIEDDQIEIGIKEEMEHTTDPAVARQIAMDHLKENPDYYRKLKSIGLKEINANARKHIAPTNFVFPKEKRYPIHDLAHARNALARASGKPEESKVKSAVYKKWPSLKKD